MQEFLSDKHCLEMSVNTVVRGSNNPCIDNSTCKVVLAIHIDYQLHYQHIWGFPWESPRGIPQCTKELIKLHNG